MPQGAAWGAVAGEGGVRRLRGCGGWRRATNQSPVNKLMFPASRPRPHSQAAPAGPHLDDVAAARAERAHNVLPLPRRLHLLLQRLQQVLAPRHDAEAVARLGGCLCVSLQCRQVQGGEPASSRQQRRLAAAAAVMDWERLCAALACMHCFAHAEGLALEHQQRAGALAAKCQWHIALACNNGAVECTPVTFKLQSMERRGKRYTGEPKRRPGFLQSSLHAPCRCDHCCKYHEHASHAPNP